MATEPTNLRLDAKTKAEAYEIFNAIGIKPTQAFNLFLRQVALHKGLPFDVKIPNSETIEAMQELENGGGTHHKTAEDMYKDLGI
ncbi:MAG: type II toxin-antitoxin system RelB/DinJ family antitoxin [Pseudomonadota bacterium]